MRFVISLVMTTMLVGCGGGAGTQNRGGGDTNMTLPDFVSQDNVGLQRNPPDFVWKQDINQDGNQNNNQETQNANPNINQGENQDSNQESQAKQIDKRVAEFENKPVVNLVVGAPLTGSAFSMLEDKIGSYDFLASNQQAIWDGSKMVVSNAIKLSP